MDYPVWQLTTFGGGFWIIVIAVLHVFVAHFAVGGGLFLVLTETKARRLDSAPLLAYAKRYTRFFLLLTMVFGALSGVGIWLTISILSPQATLVLVRTFVWGWATEWAFFAGEIAALLIYYYGFDLLDAKTHLRVGWLYFLFAFLSLFVINGIISFMLTPGTWPESLDFWAGFFNPTFWPSVVLRFALALLVAGLFVFATALGIADEPARRTMLRTACRWVVLSTPVLLLSGVWYVAVLPGPVRTFVAHGSAEIAPYRVAYPVLLVLLAGGAVALASRLPLGLRRALTVVLLLLGLGLVGTFETIREAARKPWLITDLLWSTDLRPSHDLPRDAPFLPRARFAKVKQITDKNRLEAGHELYAMQCLACHSVGGPFKDIRRYTGHIGQAGVAAYLTGQGKLFTQMPPFLGSPAERDALAAYITEGVNGKKPVSAEPVAITPPEVPLPAFDAEKSPYLLLGYNSLGMVALAGADGSFSLAVPGNTLRAVLIKRDVMPEVVTEDVTIAYAAPEGFKHPARRLAFWKHARALTGEPLEADTSVTGLRPDGVMQAGDKLFSAVGVPVTPYPDTGGVDPYPVFTLTAKKTDGGEPLAATKVVAPVSTEMRCFTCHGGAPAVDGVTGVSSRTAASILAVHDKRNGTDLAVQVRAGNPVACQHCHGDDGPNAGPRATGRAGLLSLSAAIHGFHASYLSGGDSKACANCHPANPDGVTQAQRDNHSAAGIGCVNCHGYMEDHALSLLVHEKQAGKKAAAWLMGPLSPRSVATLAEVHPRAAWTQEPDCLTCHKDFTRPGKNPSAFNAWTRNAAGLFRNRKEDTGNVPCAACHGSPHATFVAVNGYGLDINNIAPMQYMGFPGVIGSSKRCDVCHTVEMEGGDVHHPNMQP